MKKFIKAKQITSILTVGVFIFLAFGSSEDKSDSSLGPDVEESNIETPTKEQTAQELTGQLEKELASFNAPFNNGIYTGSVEALKVEIVLFGVWADLIERGENSELESNVALAKELRAKVSKLQSLEFPRIREHYGKLLAEKLWEEDISVRTVGKKHSTLDFTGGIFASNKNIKSFQTTLDEALRLFRFKQTRYRWYEGADEYTYYDIEVLKDGDVVAVSE